MCSSLDTSLDSFPENCVQFSPLSFGRSHPYSRDSAKIEENSEANTMSFLGTHPRITQVPP